MQHVRKTLTLRPIAPANDPGQPVGASDLITAAIARRVCVDAVYNRTQVRLAPHILYTRHGDPFVDAVVVERAGAQPRDVKLSVFKLAGLSAIALTARPIAPRLQLDPSDPRYAGTTLSALKALRF